MPLTRGEAVGYDADLMAFGFTMKNGQQIVQCQISRAALVDLVGRSTGGARRDLPAQFEAHRELIEAITSAEFDRISNEETRLVRIFAKHIPSHPTQVTTRIRVPIQLMRQEVKADGCVFAVWRARLLSNDGFSPKN